jgi:Ca2+-transporting ATPase
VAEQQSIVFTVLCLDQLSNALAVRSNNKSIFTMNVFKNKQMIGALLLTFALQAALIYLPVLHTVFKTTWIDTKAVIAILVVMVISTVLRDVTKLIIARAYKNG